MPLDATVGGTAANSFMTLEEFDAYLADSLYGATLLTETDSRKEAALIMAARQLRSICYLGSKVASTQALPFPRLGLELDGHELDSTTLPSPIVIAQAELAIIYLRSATDPTLESEASAQGLTKLKAGPVELGFREGETYKSVPANIRAMIPASWLCPEATTKKGLYFQSV